MGHHAPESVDDVAVRPSYPEAEVRPGHRETQAARETPGGDETCHPVGRLAYGNGVEAAACPVVHREAQRAETA